jgi:translation elongation factor P/translation initiation factor 5A
MSRMEMIYIDCEGQARHTGVGAAMATNAATWAAFKSYRRMEVPKIRARFLLDYYNAKGDLADTILLDAAGFELISNEKAKTEAEYRKIDPSTRCQYTQAGTYSMTICWRPRVTM